MRVLFLTTVLPSRERGGGGIVSRCVIDSLRRAGHSPRVLGYLRPGEAARPGDGEVCVGVRPIETSSAGPRKLAWMALAVATRAPYSSLKYRSSAYRRLVRRELAEDPDVVIVDHAQIHFALEPGPVPVVHLAHNAEAELYGRLSARSRALGRWVNAREARRMRDVEARLARRADQVWTLTESDADHFRRLVRDSDVRTLPVASRLGPVPLSATPGCDVALLGSWSWDANARGLEWFCDRVLPLVPELRIEVGGGGADWLRGRHPNVSARGFVDDAMEFIAGTRVVAVPGVTGGGIQVKTLDAIASGLPVVATSAAVRGLDELPASVSVADDAGLFAGELRRLAFEGIPELVREGALAWSQDRRHRFESAVRASLGDLVRDDHGRAGPPVETWCA